MHYCLIDPYTVKEKLWLRSAFIFFLLFRNLLGVEVVTLKKYFRGGGGSIIPPPYPKKNISELYPPGWKPFGKKKKSYKRIF